MALTQRAQEIARKNDMVMEVRNSWGNKVPVWKPLYSQEKGLRLGITRQQMAYSLRSATNGVPLGEYREGDVFMPILLKDADRDSMNLNDIKTLPVYSAKGRSVKVEQVIDDFSLDYEYSVVKRYNRQRYMMMQCEPKRGANTMAAFSQLWQEIQQEVQVPEGYKLQYFGEQSEQGDCRQYSVDVRSDLSHPVVPLPEILPEAGLDHVYVASDLHRCGIGVAGVWQVARFLCHVRSVRSDRYEYQECDRAGGRNRIAA